MKVTSGVFSVSDYPNGDWWTGTGPREEVQHVNFPAKMFSRPPQVMAAISMLDAGNKAGTRISAVVRNVSKDHFDLHVSTWADTAIAGVSVSWIAVGE